MKKVNFNKSKRLILLVSIVGLILMMAGCSFFQGLKKNNTSTTIPPEDSLLSKHIPGQVLIKTNNRHELEKVLNSYDGEIVDYIEKLQLYRINVDISIKGSLSGTIKALKSIPGFIYVEPVYVYQPLIEINDSEYLTRQWGPMSIGLGEALELAPAQGEGVVVAVLDTGVDYTHPEFTGRVLPGYNVFTEEVGYEAALDDFGHGTHVAGIIAASLNSEKIAGIAPKSKILPVKVLTAEGGTDYGVARGIIWAIENGADIINMSLGGKGYSQGMQDAINLAIANNIVVVAAMGNTGKKEVLYPGGCTGVIAVGASNGQGKVANFSTRGSHISLLAPGENIYSTIPVEMGEYNTYDGTSMATPHVTGAVALLLGENPDMMVSQIKTHLEATAKDIGAVGFDWESGYGILDLVKLLNEDHLSKYGSLKVSVTYYGKPLAGAEVTLINTQNQPVRSAKTDSKGTVLIHNLEIGTYNVIINAYGTIVEESNVNISSGSLTELVIPDIAPILPTSLEGYVVESRGGAGVPAVQLTISSETTDTVLTTATDENGYFSIPLGADTYTVIAEKTGYGTSKYQSVIVEENRIKSLTIIQPPMSGSTVNTNPPTISVTGVGINDTLSGIVEMMVKVSGNSETASINVRFGHFNLDADYKEELTDEMLISLDTVSKGNGNSFIDILVYDINGNVTEWTIPVVINNTVGDEALLPKVLINGCWAVTYGQSLGLYRKEIQNFNRDFGINKNPDILEINGQEFDISSAPDDATVLVKLQWGMRFEATGYRLYRSTSYEGPYYQIADISQTEYIDCDSILQVGQKYYYKVVAYNSSGMGEPSNPVWTEPIEVFNVSLVEPVNGGIVTSFTPSFLWSHTPVTKDRMSFYLVVEGITDPTEVWTKVVWDSTNVVYDGLELVSEHEYKWSISEAQATKTYGNYSGALSISGQNGEALNNSFILTIDSEAGEPVRETLFSMEIDEADGVTDYIQLDITEGGNYEIYTEKSIEDCDTVLYLYDEDCDQIGYNDDDNNYYSKISTYLYPGTYFIKVEEYKEDGVSHLYCYLFVERVIY